jgi:hypothetical protein
MLISSIRLANSEIDDKIINITVFNKLYKYYMNCYSNYYYISKMQINQTPTSTILQMIVNIIVIILIMIMMLYVLYVNVDMQKY